MKLQDLLTEAKEDFVTKAVKPLKLKWKRLPKSKEGYSEIVTELKNGDSFMIYYDLDDESDVGWSMGEKLKNGKYDWNGSGTDDLPETIRILKSWIKGEDI